MHAKCMGRAAVRNVKLKILKPFGLDNKKVVFSFQNKIICVNHSHSETIYFFRKFLRYSNLSSSCENYGSASNLRRIEEFMSMVLKYSSVSIEFVCSIREGAHRSGRNWTKFGVR